MAGGLTTGGEPPPGVRWRGQSSLVLADDDSDLRELVRAMVMTGEENEFVVVGEASNGVEALKVAATHQPDIVLLDLSMPGMQGASVISAIVERCPRTSVVVLSGLEAADGAAALTAGADAYLIKGASRSELLATLRRVVDIKRRAGS